MTYNIFVLKIQVEKQRQTRPKGNVPGKLYCCFMELKKERKEWTLCLVLCCGRCWKALVSMGGYGHHQVHDSITVRIRYGLSEIFRCLMGVKQVCPLSPTLFGQ